MYIPEKAVPDCISVWLSVSVCLSLSPLPPPVLLSLFCLFLSGILPLFEQKFRPVCYNCWTYLMHPGILMTWSWTMLFTLPFWPWKKGIFSAQLSDSLSRPLNGWFFPFFSFEGQISAKNIEIGIIGVDKKFRSVILEWWSLSSVLNLILLFQS